MSEVNFEHYKIFYYAAKFNNITAAANYPYLSQPSVSRSIQTLELGCKLFSRSKKGVELTEGGKILYKHIDIACRHIFSTEEEISLMTEHGASVIRIGGSTIALQSFLNGEIAEFHRQHTKLRIKITPCQPPTQ